MKKYILSVLIFSLSFLFFVGRAKATYQISCGGITVTCACDQCPGGGPYSCPGGSQCLKIGCSCVPNGLNSYCAWSNNTWSSCGPAPTPPPGPGGGGGGCPSCQSLASTPNNCGEVGMDPGSGSCGAGERCCQPKGGGPTCNGTATVCFKNDDCKICGAGQCCTTGDTGVAGNCRFWTASYPFNCGAVTNYCGQAFQCDGTHYCPSTQATLIEAAPTGMSPADNTTVTPVLTCGSVCVNDIDCGGHWIEGTMMRNGATPIAKYRRLTMDAIQLPSGTLFEETSTAPPIGKTKGWAGGWSSASFSGGAAMYTDSEYAAFWFPLSGPSANILSYKTNIGAYMRLAVDGKTYGSDIALNSVDVPPAAFKFPTTVPTGSQKDFFCEDNSKTCRLRSVPSDPLCNDTSTTHTVRIVNKATAGSPYMDVDAFIEDGVKIEHTDPRILWSPTMTSWTPGNGAQYSGGSERYTSLAGRYVQFTTTATSLKWVTYKAVNRGSADVYVDGVLTQTINNKITTAPQSQVQQDITLPAGTHTPLDGTETSVLLSWNPGIYSRWNLELYPVGKDCSDPNAFCGRLVRPNYRLVPAPGVSQYQWRVQVVNDLCVNYNVKPLFGFWSPFYTFNLNINVDVPGTVSEDTTGSAVLVGGVCQTASSGVYKGGGTVSITGNSQNRTASVSTTDGKYTVTSVPTNTGYTLSFAPSSSTYDCSCPAGCSYSNVTIPEPTNLPFYVTAISSPWYQTVGGDVGAFTSGVGFSVQDPIPIATCIAPGCSSYLSLPLVPGNQSTSGSLVVQGSTQVDLKNTANGPQNDNVAQTSRLVKLGNPYIPKENYDYFYRLYSLGLNPSDDFVGGGKNPAAATKPNGNPANGKTAFYRNGDLTITSAWSLNANDSIVIFVNGNLNIRANISVPTAALPQKPFLGFIVSGDITIDPSVGTGTFSSTSNGQVQGFYLADGKISAPTAGAGGTDLKLICEGTFAAGNGISVKRDYRNGGNGLMNNQYPVALFIYRPDIFRSVPDRMKVPLTVWKEATP